jgi:hypothetical protein
MPIIESLVIARPLQKSDAGFSSWTREELEAELARLRRRETLFDATERAAKIGYYEWDYESDRLVSCSAEYAAMFGMTVEAVKLSQDSWQKTLQYIHPDDHERYTKAAKELRDNRSLSIDYRILLADGSLRHVREFGIVVVDDEDVARGSFGLLQDISEQVKYDRDLEYRDELARQTKKSATFTSARVARESTAVLLRLTRNRLTASRMTLQISLRKIATGLRKNIGITSRMDRIARSNIESSVPMAQYAGCASSLQPS